jgi:hypothetical protein
LTVAHVVNALVEHAPALFEVADSAVYLYRDGTLSLQSARGFGGSSPDVAPDADELETLRQGKAARPDANDDAPVYVPIVVPRAKNPDLLGVLYLGRRDGEKGYSQLEVQALEALGRKGGMALYLSEARMATAPGTPGTTNAPVIVS